MRGWTADQVEQALLADEAIIAAARARQLANLALAAQMQLPIADGCRTLKEWVAGRLDVSLETAYRLSSTAHRIADDPGLARALLNGEITFDRAEVMSRIPIEDRADWQAGVDINGLRRIAARHRRMTRVDDHRSHAASELTMQPNLDESRWRLWGDLDGYSWLDRRQSADRDRRHHPRLARRHPSWSRIPQGGRIDRHLRGVTPQRRHYTAHLGICRRLRSRDRRRDHGRTRDTGQSGLRRESRTDPHRRWATPRRGS